MDIGTRHLDHIKEDHLLQEENGIRMEKPKYFQRNHLNGDLVLIILSVLLDFLSRGQFVFFKYSSKKIHNIIHFSINFYSTISTEDAVFIIDGKHNEKRIAEYKNAKWTNVGQLEKRRIYTRSITFGRQTMIIDVMNPTVEIWNLEQRKKLTMFERPIGVFDRGFGVFLVPKDFCS